MLICNFLNTSRNIENCLFSLFFLSRWGIVTLGIISYGGSSKVSDFSMLWGRLADCASWFSVLEFLLTTTNSTSFPLLKVMALHSSFWLTSIVLSKLPCCLPVSMLVSWPTWTWGCLILEIDVDFSHESTSVVCHLCHNLFKCWLLL